MSQPSIQKEGSLLSSKPLRNPNCSNLTVAVCSVETTLSVGRLRISWNSVIRRRAYVDADAELGICS